MDRQYIGRLIALEQLGHVLPNDPMVMPIEVVFAHDITDPLPGGVIEHDGTKHRLLSLNRMRGYPERSNFAIEGKGSNRFGLCGHDLMVTRGAARPPGIYCAALHTRLALFGGSTLREIEQKKPDRRSDRACLER